MIKYIIKECEGNKSIGAQDIIRLESSDIFCVKEYCLDLPEFGVMR